MFSPVAGEGVEADFLAAAVAAFRAAVGTPEAFRAAVGILVASPAVADIPVASPAVVGIQAEVSIARPR